jgi:uncharacterized protein (DUF1800 family)
MDTNAAIAFSRFGLGRRRDEPLPADARAWLHAQLDGPDPAPTAGLPTVAEALALAQQVAMAAKIATPERTQANVQTPEHDAFKQQARAESMAFLSNAMLTPAGFRERLVWFWANHFTVAARSRITVASLGPYIREAIRPHVTGKFRDMLLAVMRHPAMLDYLDQSASKGPDSRIGAQKHQGLNENLARECLELHTVTPASLYTQADVTNFAKVLTGWTVQMGREPRGFVFRPEAHEPGEQVVMGRVWPDGEAGGVELLTWLADHPETQRHLAEKLVRHFVADDPPAADVAHIQAVLRTTGGDLGAAARAVTFLPRAWQPLTKMRAPLDYVIATMRAVGANPPAEPHVMDMVRNLGEPLFQAPFPIGWPDRAADWSGPEALLQRVDFAYQFAARVTDQEPMEVAENTLGPLLAAATLDEIRHASSRQDGLTLFLASPEFQRR